MANTFLTIAQITYEALAVLMNNAVALNCVTRGYDNQFARSGGKVGDTINIRKPPRYTVREGRVAVPQDITETYVPLRLAYQDGVDMNWTTADRTLTIDNYRDRYIKPAVVTLVNKIDQRILALYSNFHNVIGTPGTIPNDLLTWGKAMARLDNEAAPRDEDRHVLMGALPNVYAVDAGKGLFHAGAAISDQYRRGMMGKGVMGADWYMDQNVATHTVGPLGGTPLVNGASQTGASLVTDGWTAAAATRLKLGDVFTLAGVYAVNPQSRANTGELRQFVATADVASDGSGNATIPISPSIVTSGAFQTVTGSPADDAALTVVGAANTITLQNMVMHRSAIVVGMADLVIPRGGAEGSRVSDEQLGVSIRMVEGYDVIQDIEIVRLDVLYGMSVVYPEMGVRVAA